MSNNRPTPGRIVHVSMRGQLGSAGKIVCRPAIIVRVAGPTAEVLEDAGLRVTIFCDTHEEHLHVTFDSEGLRAPLTWHWPERSE